MSKFYFPKVKILYLHPDPKLGTIFAPRETLVLEMQLCVKFNIIFAPSPYINSRIFLAHIIIVELFPCLCMINY